MRKKERQQKKDRNEEREKRKNDKEMRKEEMKRARKRRKWKWKIRGPHKLKTERGKALKATREEGQKAKESWPFFKHNTVDDTA